MLLPLIVRLLRTDPMKSIIASSADYFGNLPRSFSKILPLKDLRYPNCFGHQLRMQFKLMIICAISFALSAPLNGGADNTPSIPEQKETLDLSSWEFALVGSDTVHQTDINIVHPELRECRVQFVFCFL